MAQVRANAVNPGAVTYTVISPEGAAVTASGEVHYTIGRHVASGTLIDFEVMATVDAFGKSASATAAWKIRVVRSVINYFESAAELADFTTGLGDGAAQFAGDIVITPAPLNVVLPGPGNPSFDSWCGFDHSPRLLEKIQAFSTFDLETHMVLDPNNFPTTLENHIGLGIDRGLQDLQIFGIYNRFVRMERTCCLDGDCGAEAFNTTVKPFDTPDTFVTLRIEKRGENIKYLAKLDNDAGFTLALEQNVSRPRPVGVGLAAKTWGGQGNTGAIFEYLQYGAPIECGKDVNVTISDLAVTGSAGRLHRQGHRLGDGLRPHLLRLHRHDGRPGDDGRAAGRRLGRPRPGRRHLGREGRRLRRSGLLHRDQVHQPSRPAGSPAAGSGATPMATARTTSPTPSPRSPTSSRVGPPRPASRRSTATPAAAWTSPIRSST